LKRRRGMAIQEQYELLQNEKISETIDTGMATTLEQLRAKLETKKDVKKEVLEKLITRENADQVVREIKKCMSAVGYKVFIYSIMRRLTGDCIRFHLMKRYLYFSKLGYGLTNDSLSSKY
jgi:hypothetical protein